MFFKRTFIFLSLFSFTIVYAQKIYVPYNIQQAVINKTRTNSGVPGEKYFQNHSSYKIKARFNTRTGELNGRANITYFNNSTDTLHKIVMRVYQNIFRPDAIRDDEVEAINQSEGMVISDLYVNGESYSNEMSLHTRTEGTNFYILLKNDLRPGDSCQINIAWNFTMPQTAVHRFGKYSDATFFVAMWYPQIAVYDDIDGWDEMQYNSTQEFYNDFNDFDVTISVAAGNMVWATGNWVNAEDLLTAQVFDRYQKAGSGEELVHIIRQGDLVNNAIFKGGRNSFRYIAKQIPDFVFATSNHYLWDATSVIVDSQNKKRVLVSAVYPVESVDFSNVAAVGAEIVERLSSESYGISYPYFAVTVFNGDGGMEYPMMINNRSSRNYSSSVFLTLHEIAHGYFPFMTGINERKYSWIDEGLTSYLPMETQDSLKSDYNTMSSFVARYDVMSGTDADIPLMVPAYQTKEYSYLYYSYYRSTMAFYMLENLMGRDTFRLAIRNFIETWKGKHPTPYDLFNCFKKATQTDTEWLIDQWFFGSGYPDLAIADVSTDNENVKVHIRNMGNFPVPVVLNFIYENGDTITVKRNIAIWKDHSRLHINQPIKPGLKKIELGNFTIPDKDRKDNLYEL